MTSFSEQRTIEYVEPKEALRRRLPLRYAASLYGIVFDADGRALCPWHGDSRPSLEAYASDDGTHERWTCFPCRALGLEPSGGDVFSLIARAEGVPFSAAVSRARALSRDIPTALAAPTSGPRPEIDGSLWEGLLEGTRGEALRRPDELERSARFPEGRGWAEKLVLRWGWGLSSDGWALVPHRGPDGALTGIKLRNPDGTGMSSVDGSRFRYLYGAWRPSRVVAVVCEGETDAVHAQRDLDAACIDGVAYGVPGASTFPTAEMLEPLRNTVAYVCFDGDGPGQAAAHRWASALAGIASTVCYASVPEGTDLRSCGLRFWELPLQVCFTSPDPIGLFDPPSTEETFS